MIRLLGFIFNVMNKFIEFRCVKRLVFFLLFIVVVIFVVMLFLLFNFWVSGVKVIVEVVMVGVLVDWFVVVVLFCCVLILIIFCYMVIILCNKDWIGENFG